MVIPYITAQYLAEIQHETTSECLIVFIGVDEEQFDEEM